MLNEIAPHVQRVVDEKKELDGKIDKLRAFQGTELFAGLVLAERCDMYRQLEVMKEYSVILGLRLTRAGVGRDQRS